MKCILKYKFDAWNDPNLTRCTVHIRFQIFPPVVALQIQNWHEVFDLTYLTEIDSKFTTICLLGFSKPPTNRDSSHCTLNFVFLNSSELNFLNFIFFRFHSFFFFLLFWFDLSDLISWSTKHQSWWKSWRDFCLQKKGVRYHKRNICKVSFSQV